MHIRTLVVDDTVIYRKAFEQAVCRFSGVEVVGKVQNGQEALDMLEREEIDLVLLDLFMPVMDGMETLREIKKRHPDTAVVMISGGTPKHAEVTVEALGSGALDFLIKPSALSFEDGVDRLERELSRIIPVVSVSLRTRRIRGKSLQVSKKLQQRELTGVQGFDLILVGSSTGGPNALMELFSGLGEGVGCPVLIVQHMPPSFTEHLASHLDRLSKMRVKEGEDGDVLRRDCVYLAPGGKHMVVGKDYGGMRLHLNEDDMVHSCRPSVDVLFKSVARLPSMRILMLVLTGMGRDGTDGVDAVKKAHCKSFCIAESRESCVVYGMPKAVVEAGLADEVLDLGMMSTKISEMIREERVSI